MQLRSGKLPFTAGDYPAVFYDGEYNKDALWTGLLRSQPLVLVRSRQLLAVHPDISHPL